MSPAPASDTGDPGVHGRVSSRSSDVPHAPVARPFRIPTSQGGYRISPALRPIPDIDREATEASSLYDHGGHATQQSQQPSQLDLSASGQSEETELATQGGGPLPVQIDELAGFCFQDLSRAVPRSASLLDPLSDLLSKITSARTVQDLRAVIHPAGLFDGLNNAEATYTTTSRWLCEIEADQQNHVEIGADDSFSIRMLLPVPFRVAIQTVALAEGWPAEGLLLAVASNVGWLEHHATRLKQRSTDDHGRSPNIGFFHGMDPSMGKSSLKNYATRTLLQGDDVEQTIKDGIAVCVDGTLKGHRTSLANVFRSGIETDEVTTAYHCGSGPESTTRGMHFASREKL